MLYPVELRAHLRMDCREKTDPQVIALNHPPATASQGGRGRGIRTPDTLLPKQVRYQAALYPAAPDLSELNGAERGRDTTNAAPLRQSGRALRAPSATSDRQWFRDESDAGLTKNKGCRSTLCTFKQIGAPGEIRTPDHQVRSLVLYPTELRARGTPHSISRRRALPCRAAGRAIIRIAPRDVNPASPNVGPRPFLRARRSRKNSRHLNTCPNMTQLS